MKWGLNLIKKTFPVASLQGSHREGLWTAPRRTHNKHQIWLSSAATQAHAFLKGAAWLTAVWMISAPGKWSSVPPPLDTDKYSPCISLVLRYWKGVKLFTKWNTEMTLHLSNFDITQHRLLSSNCWVELRQADLTSNWSPEKQFPHPVVQPIPLVFLLSLPRIQLFTSVPTLVQAPPIFVWTVAVASKLVSLPQSMPLCRWGLHCSQQAPCETYTRACHFSVQDLQEPQCKLLVQCDASSA